MLEGKEVALGVAKEVCVSGVGGADGDGVEVVDGLGGEAQDTRRQRLNTFEHLKALDSHLNRPL
jgi:hypothetical protein